MEPAPTFWCEPTDTAEVRLRVFTFGRDINRPADPGRPDHEACPGRDPVVGGSMDGHNWGHEASNVVLAETPIRLDERERQEVWPVAEFKGDPAWPAVCVHCGNPVGDAWVRQVQQDAFYRAAFSAVPEGQRFVGQQWNLRDLPVGAMYEAKWMADVDAWTGDDGMALCIIVPGGGDRTHVFQPDSGASNCDRKGERHHCWCRQGNPRTEPVHVGKDYCDTCSAGAGSIGVGDPSNYAWHGYVHHGYVVEA